MMNLPLNIDFSGKVVVVTGAGGLICGAMARAFAQSGAKVAALDLNEEAVKKLAAELKAEGFICEGYIRPDHGRHLWNEGPGNVRPGYGLYDRALGIMYMLGAWDQMDKQAGKKTTV